MDNMFKDPVDHVMVTGGPALYVILLHRLAKQGKATTYGGTNNRLVQFNLDSLEGEMIKNKWPGLRDAERVWLIYRDRRITL